MHLNWEEKLNTGVYCFDEEHRTILRMLNFLRELLSAGRRKEATSFITGVLIPYLTEHLRHEEEVFKLFGYPEGERHARSHTSVENLFRGFVAPLEEGEDRFIRHFQAVVMGWLYGHIEKSDKRYGEYFVREGILDRVNEIEPIRREW